MTRDEALDTITDRMRRLYSTGAYYVSIPGGALGFEEGYWHTVSDPDGTVRNRLEERDQFLGDIAYIVDHVAALPPGVILDHGCGLGWFLSALPESWDRHGLEVSRTAADVAERHGTIHRGPLATAPYEPGMFDVIVSHHVIEHLERPEEELARLRRVLRDDGLLVVGTPDFDSGCARRFGRRYRLLHDETHVSLFSNDSLHRFVRDHGFRIEGAEYPYFDTRFFTTENLLRLFDTGEVSPPFHGNFMTLFCRKVP